jgi:hypothetical protein
LFFQGGLIYIVDKTTYAILDKFSIKRILFCAAGDKQITSLGFTTASEPQEADGAGPAETETFECHVFDFPAVDKMELALAQIAASFGNFEGEDGRDGGQIDALRYELEVSIVVSEQDGATRKWTHCPFFKNTFKLRSTTSRLQFTFTFSQTSKQSLLVDQGFSVSIGKALSVEAAQTPELRNEAFIAMQMVSSSAVSLIRRRRRRRRRHRFRRLIPSVASMRASMRATHPRVVSFGMSHYLTCCRARGCRWTAVQ